MRIVVTRPEGQEARLVELLQAAGHSVAACPLIEVVPTGSEPVDVTPYDWVVLTSANAARELVRRMHGEPRRVAAVGRATAEAFGHVDLVPRVSTQEGLLAELPQPAGRVLFAGAAGARPLLVETLGADVVVLYETRELHPTDFPDADLCVVASPSAARALAVVAPAVPVVSIGPETSAAASANGLRVVAEAATHDLEGLVAAVERTAWPR